MEEQPYSKREIDLLHESIHEKLDLLIREAKYTNGKIRKLTLAMVAVVCVLLGMGLQNAPLLLSLLGI